MVPKLDCSAASISELRMLPLEVNETSICGVGTRGIKEGEGAAFVCVRERGGPAAPGAMVDTSTSSMSDSETSSSDAVPLTPLPVGEDVGKARWSRQSVQERVW